MKWLFLLPVVFALASCAQNEVASTDPAEMSQTQKVEQTAEKGAKTAARFVVGRVTGPPVHVAMAANTIAHKVSDKLHQQPADPAAAPSPTPAQ